MGGGGWWFGLVINKKNHSLEFMNHGEYFFSFVGLNNSYDLIHHSCGYYIDERNYATKPDTIQICDFLKNLRKFYKM